MSVYTRTDGVGESVCECVYTRTDGVVCVCVCVCVYTRTDGVGKSVCECVCVCVHQDRWGRRVCGHQNISGRGECV